MMIENFDQLMEQAGDLHAKGNLPGSVKIYANLIAMTGIISITANDTVKTLVLLVLPQR